ncbi:phosphotriesterase [Pseudonocardia nematodicida]|uniref:Phosphotriesterase n=1 Tax=Pseudonocardia nematodicida TaxID=1206997 RepID=A0ABV1KI34_9PSEU
MTGAATTGGPATGAVPGCIVRTVLGDVPAADLGPTNYHEHLFQVSPLLPGDELDDEAASGAEARTLVEAGIAAMVEATPTGLGRDPEAVARISRTTGLRVVHVTGGHRTEHYPDGHWLTTESEDALRVRFTADVVDGLPRSDVAGRGPVASTPDGAPVRAGMVKAGVGYWRISACERRVLAAVAATARDTGVAAMVHLEYCSAAFEVLEHLAAGGLPADRVVLAHVDRNLDAGLHAELAATGAYLGYDGPARHREAPDSAILDVLAAVVDSGGLSRVLLGGDVARRSRYRAHGGIPGLDYLPRRFLPRLADRVGDDAVRAVLHENPARILTLAGTDDR